MGMIDSECVLSAAQAPTLVQDTASTNVYDSGSANSSDISMTGENLWITCRCTTTATSDGSATVQAVLQDSADNSSFADVVAGTALAVASVTAGTVMLQVQPPTAMRRYMRIVYRIAVAALTAGKFDAFVSNTIQRNVARPSGFTVS